MKQIVIKNSKNELIKFKSSTEVAKQYKVTPFTVRNWLKGATQPKNSLDIQSIQYADDEEDFIDEPEYLKNKFNKIIANEKNVETYLTNKFQTFALNDWTKQIEVDGMPMTDDWFNTINFNMGKEIEVNNPKLTQQCLSMLASEWKYNPLKEKIDMLEWDGKPRAESFFIDFVGAQDTDINRIYTKCWFKAAIKRLYEPGCMWDYMIILHDQTHGTGKTKIFDRLSMGFYAQDPDVSNKDAINIMNFAWIINFDELANFDKKDMNSLKKFITTRSDVNRLAYGHYAEDFPRHCIFCGTTNENFFLRDYSSQYERRFWVINCHGVKKPDSWWNENLPDDYIEQVWAEVKHWYDQDPNVIVEMTPEQHDTERLIQMGHKSFNKDPETMVILRNILNGKFSKTALVNFNVLKKEVFSCEFDPSRDQFFDEIEILTLAAILKKPEEYVAMAVLKDKNWTVKDGKAVRIKTTQLDLPF